MGNGSTVYFDEDVDLSVLKNKTIAVIGYGNQGQAHALNFRDSGLSVIVGNIKDAYWEMAEKDGFEVHTIDKAVELGDIVCIFIPDEMQPEVYQKMIESKLSPGKALVFASGFNIHFGFIEPPEFVDVGMEAPRMIGVGVRDRFVKELGFPTLIAVQQDASGKAKEIVLALAKAVGATRVGAFESSFEEEVVLDTFSEQGCFAGLYALFQAQFEILVEAGYNPDLVVLELWKSGEIIEEIKAWVETGFFKQMGFHSTTSQYGSMTRGPRIVTEETRKTLRRHLEEIQSGIFAREWMVEQRSGCPVFRMLKKNCLSHGINEVEERLDNILRTKEVGASLDPEI